MDRKKDSSDSSNIVGGKPLSIQHNGNISCDDNGIENNKNDERQTSLVLEEPVSSSSTRKRLYV